MTRETVVELMQAITGNIDASSTGMRQAKNGKIFGSSGIEAGGRIVLGTATTADVLIVDATGKILHNATVTSNKTIDPIPAGVKGPISVAVTNISNSAHTLTVYWWVKK